VRHRQLVDSASIPNRHPLPATSSGDVFAHEHPASDQCYRLDDREAVKASLRDEDHIESSSDAVFAKTDTEAGVVSGLGTSVARDLRQLPLGINKAGWLANYDFPFIGNLLIYLEGRR
jgi:hypothetical protein